MIWRGQEFALLTWPCAPTPGTIWHAWADCGRQRCAADQCIHCAEGVVKCREWVVLCGTMWYLDDLRWTWGCTMLYHVVTKACHGSATRCCLVGPDVRCRVARESSAASYVANPKTHPKTINNFHQQTINMGWIWDDYRHPQFQDIPGFLHFIIGFTTFTAYDSIWFSLPPWLVASSCWQRHLKMSPHHPTFELSVEFLPQKSWGKNCPAETAWTIGATVEKAVRYTATSIHIIRPYKDHHIYGPAVSLA